MEEVSLNLPLEKEKKPLGGSFLIIILVWEIWLERNRKVSSEVDRSVELLEIMRFYVPV